MNDKVNVQLTMNCTLPQFVLDCVKDGKLNKIDILQLAISLWGQDCDIQIKDKRGLNDRGLSNIPGNVSKEEDSNVHTIEL